ncbi:MAG: transposase family protein [Lentisphaerae bacterium]|nr:transposase family protein [Lentisphaerota bacterium]
MNVSQTTRREYMERIRDRYARAGRRHKTRILDEFCAVCGYERKHAIKLLRGSRTGPRDRPGPGPMYGAAERKVAERIWWAAQQPCSKRLKEMLPLWLPGYERRHGPLKAKVREKVVGMSASTLDRLLAPYRAQAARRRRTGTRPGRLLRTHIPIRAGEWQIDGPGYLEADSVAHCGESMSGNFVWSVTFTDIHTGWTEVRAVWNRGSVGVLQQVREVEASLPFVLRGFDCDNGSEFLNWHLIRYFQDRPEAIEFTRSRPYHKNDNAHVEQKNWTHVRQWLGYDRFEDPRVVDRLNDLYRNEWSWWHNFFCASTKLVAKTRVKSRMVKTHDRPRTPYQRLRDGPGLSAERRDELDQLFHRLDPFDLTERIERKLRAVFRLVHPSLRREVA